MEGAEMGLNEAGVAIGNEAVFSRFRAVRDGVLGMDLVRAVLASCKDARLAVDFLCDATEAMDQGGRGSYHGGPSYSNSYIISDFGSAYVVETAGRRWAWREIEGFASISNAYSIEEDYKRLDSRTRKEIAPVNPRAACSDEADAGRKGHKESWRRSVEEKWPWAILKGDSRRRYLLSSLESKQGRIDRFSFLAMLRSHAGYNPARPLMRRMEGVCLHGGGLVDHATTASLAVEYVGAGATLGIQALAWYTGCSYPCLSLYKPILLGENGFVPLWAAYDHRTGSAQAFEYWIAHRSWARGRGRLALSQDNAFVARRDAIQARIGDAAELGLGGHIETARQDVSAAMDEWQGFLDSLG